MKRTIRYLISAFVTSVLVLGGSTVSFARISLGENAQSLSGFNDVVEAQFLPSGNRILVLSHVAASTVAKLDAVDPSTNSVVDSVIFNQAGTGDDVDWTSAADLAVSIDGTRAYVVFADSSRIVAKIDTSNLNVLDYANVGQIALQTESLSAIALRADDSVVNVYSQDGTISFNTSDLEQSVAGYTTIAVEDGVTNKAFVSDSDVGVSIWADRTDGQINGKNRVNIHAADQNLYASSFSVGTVFSALAMDKSRYDLYLGTNRRKGKNYLVRAIDYRQTQMSSSAKITIPRKAKGIRQIDISSDGTRLIALTTNNRLLRIELGGQWKASMLENSSLGKITGLSSSDLAGDSVIAVSPNGNSVYVFTEDGWIIECAVTSERVKQPL